MNRDKRKTSCSGSFAESIQLPLQEASSSTNDIQTCSKESDVGKERLMNPSVHCMDYDIGSDKLDNSCTTIMDNIHMFSNNSNEPISLMPSLLDSLLDFDDDSNTSSSWDDDVDDSENDSVDAPPSRLPSHSKSNLNIGRSRARLSHSASFSCHENLSKEYATSHTQRSMTANLIHEGSFAELLATDTPISNSNNSRASSKLIFHNSHLRSKSMSKTTSEDFHTDHLEDWDPHPPIPDKLTIDCSSTDSDETNGIMSVLSTGTFSDCMTNNHVRSHVSKHNSRSTLPVVMEENEDYDFQEVHGDGDNENESDDDVEDDDDDAFVSFLSNTMPIDTNTPNNAPITTPRLVSPDTSIDSYDGNNLDDGSHVKATDTATTSDKSVILKDSEKSDLETKTIIAPNTPSTVHSQSTSITQETESDSNNSFLCPASPPELRNSNNSNHSPLSSTTIGTDTCVVKKKDENGDDPLGHTLNLTNLSLDSSSILDTSNEKKDLEQMISTMQQELDNRLAAIHAMKNVMVQQYVQMKIQRVKPAGSKL